MRREVLALCGPLNAVVTCPFGCYGYVLVSGGSIDKLLALRSVHEVMSYEGHFILPTAEGGESEGSKTVQAIVDKVCVCPAFFSWVMVPRDVCWQSWVSLGCCSVTFVCVSDWGHGDQGPGLARVFQGNVRKEWSSCIWELRGGERGRFYAHNPLLKASYISFEQRQICHLVSRSLLEGQGSDMSDL